MGGDGCTKATGRKFIRGAKAQGKRGSGASASSLASASRSERRRIRAREFATCSISGKPLFPVLTNSSKHPRKRTHPDICVCRLGNLYLREEVIQAKLGRTLASRCPHIRSLKRDLVKCRFQTTATTSSSSSATTQKSFFTCPFTATEADGSKAFCVIRETGLVVAVRAFHDFKRKELINLITNEFEEHRKHYRELIKDTDTEKLEKEKTHTKKVLANLNTKGLSEKNYFYFTDIDSTTDGGSTKPDYNLLNASHGGGILLSPSPESKKLLLIHIMKEVRKRKLRTSSGALSGDLSSLHGARSHSSASLEGGSNAKRVKRSSTSDSTSSNKGERLVSKDNHTRKKEKDEVYASLFRSNKKSKSGDGSADKETAETLLMQGNVRGTVRC
eukprot:g3045.t1